MARHSDGKSNYRLSAPLSILLISIILIIALVIWLLNRSDDGATRAQDTAGECLQGELLLPVGGDDTIVADAVHRFNASDPVSRDFCVTAEVAGTGAPAAAYLFAGTRDQAWEAFTGTGTTIAGSADSWPQIASIPAGIAATSPTLDTLAEITLPVASDPALAAAVAGALSANPTAAAGALNRDRDIDAATAAQAPGFAALSTTELPEGHTFTALPGAGVPVWALAANASADITEDQARAAADFARGAGATISGPPAPGEVLTDTGSGSNPATLDTLLADAGISAAPAGTEDSGTSGASEAEVAAAGPTDTLITLDTSVNMNAVVDGTEESYHTLVSRTLADLSREIGAQGHQVALNNYSSPLSPGATLAWRSNVGFPDESAGADAAGAVVRLGTGGYPLTRSSVIAAVRTAAEQAALRDRPVRVVLVTSGTVGNYLDEDFLFSINAATSDAVALHVVHLGHEPVDELLATWARDHGGSAASALTTDEVNLALRAAFGL